MVFLIRQLDKPLDNPDITKTAKRCQRYERGGTRSFSGAMGDDCNTTHTAGIHHGVPCKRYMGEFYPDKVYLNHYVKTEGMCL